ncbi:hypothetical protein Hanom_Chr14g01269111 [Helianthus anomalus]
METSVIIIHIVKGIVNEPSQTARELLEISSLIARIELSLNELELQLGVCT